MPRHYEAIVIGAGHNGLTCAAYLAKAGLTVLVLEQSEHIGGMTRSAELTLPGFRSDVHGYGYQLANLSPAPFDLELHRRGFELLRPDPNFVHAFPDGRSIAFRRDLESTCANIAEFSTKDAVTWRQLATDFAAHQGEAASAINSAPVASPITAAQRQTLRSWADETLESEAVKAAFAAWCAHVGMSPDDEGSADLARAFMTLIQATGNNVVKGGMQNLPDSLARFVTDHGGDIRTGASVQKVLVDDGRAVGIRLASGEEIKATRLVASNANPARVILEFLDEVEVGATLVEKMKHYQWGLGAMTIWLALDRPVDYEVGSFAKHATYVHPTPPTLDYVATAMSEARDGNLAASPFMLCANEGTVDPSRVPAGKSSMKIVVQPVPFAIEGDATGSIPHRSWAQAKQPYADHVMKLLENDYIRDLQNHVLKRTVHSPVDTLAENPDTVEGCITHGALTLSQSGATRPIAELSQYRTPVPNVYLCGSGSHPGGGVSMGPGHNAAQAICADLGLEFEGDRRKLTAR